MADRLPQCEIRPLSEDKGGGDLMAFPDYPGCMADGEMPEAAIAERRDALASYVATLRELGHPLPSSVDEPGQVSGERIATSVQKALARRADAEGISVGALVARLLAEGLERRTGS